MLDDMLFFEHRLLRDLGGMTLFEMRGRMTVAEFYQHMSFYRRVNQGRG